MENKQETTYKKINLGMFETNHAGYRRLLKEFDEKLATRIGDDEKQLAGNKKIEAVIAKLKSVAADVRENIETFHKFSEPDAIQALACLGKALTDPSPENMDQLNALIVNFNSFRAGDEKQAAVAQQRKALAVGISAVAFYLATITAAIMFPIAIPMLLVIAASVTLPAGYFYSKYNLKQGESKEMAAEGREKSSFDLSTSMKTLKEALPRAEGNDEGKKNTP